VQGNKRGGADERRTRAPTLVDVARVSGVSVSTAGRVLREADYPVDPALAEQVRAAAARLGYVPNMVARSLRGGAAPMVGLVVGDMLDPYYGQIAEAVTQRAESPHGMAAIVCNMQRDPLLELKYCQRMWERRVAGLVLAGGGFDQWTHAGRLSALVGQIVAAGIVVVTLSPRSLDVPMFCVDNEQVGAMMAGHLVEHGHRRIGVITGPAQGEVTQQRLRGVTQVLAGAGVLFQVLHTEYSAQAGAQGVSRMMAENPGLTAFLVGSDTVALGVIDRLKEMGRSVPRDISVVSVGNTPLAGWIEPRLTTVDPGLPACCEAALDYIAARVRGEPAPAAGPFPVTLAERLSVARPPS